MNKILIAAALAAVVSTPAAANEFSGPRAELRAGLDVAHVSWEGNEGEELYSDNANSSGVTYGLGIGYDYALTSKVTLGVEANLDFSDINTQGDVLLPFNDNDVFLATEFEREIEVAARLGYALGGSTLAYAKAGYVNLGLEGTQSEGLYTRSQKLDGFSLGAGLEHKLTSRVYVKGEYRYSRYSHWHREYDEGVSHDDTLLERHKATVAVGLRF